MRSSCCRAHCEREAANCSAPVPGGAGGPGGPGGPWVPGAPGDPGGPEGPCGPIGPRLGVLGGWRAP